MSMEGRLTICNMSIEAGARIGMIAPDDTTLRIPRRPPPCAAGRGLGQGARLLAHAPVRRRRAVRPRAGVRCRAARADGELGHEPRGLRARSPASCPTRRASTTATGAGTSSARSTTCNSSPRTPLQEIAIDRVFIGSCTNAASRICARRPTVARRPPRRRARHGRRRARMAVKRQAEAEGLRPSLPRRGFRVARSRLLDVRRLERRHCSRRASAAPRRPIATSRAARAAAPSPTS